MMQKHDSEFDYATMAEELSRRMQSPRRLTLANVLSVLQIMTLIAAGIWGFLMFTVYGKPLKDLELAAAKSQPLQIEAEISLTEDDKSVTVSTSEPVGDDQGSPMIYVSFHYDFINCAKIPLEISGVAVEWLVADLEDSCTFIEINEPDALNGTIHWQPLSSRKYWFTCGRADVPEGDWEESGGGLVSCRKGRSRAGI